MLYDHDPQIILTLENIMLNLDNGASDELQALREELLHLLHPTPTPTEDYAFSESEDEWSY